ncbi:acyl-CoA synthetase [Planobispora rosea]|uniref:acyl-CoA synthetase n=1 Tax=Planobispora rosea TaxID=35762 RepID=UPI00083B9C4B|nr:acyl-CoA synthetase [Planobispora rosea]
MTERTYNLADLLEIVATADPDRPALVAGDVRLSYGELSARASRVGHHLAQVGIRPGDHVAILAYNRAEWLESMFGIHKIRAVPIPVNYRYVAGELRHVLVDSDSVAIIGERSLLARVEEVRNELPKLSHVMVLEDGGDETIPGAVPYEEALAAASPHDDFPPRSSDDRYIMYTGGTTGYPKGVEWRCEDIFFGALGGGSSLNTPISHPAQLAEAANKPGAVILNCAPVMHGAGQWMTLMGLFVGAKVVLYTERAFAPEEALALLSAEGANVLMIVGDAMGRPIAEQLANGRYDTDSLYALSSGGAPLTPAVRDALRSHLPDVRFVDNYGASETGVGGTSADGRSSGTAKFRMGPDCTVLDDELRVVAPGEIGKLARSGHIPLGYYNDPAKTAATFFTDSQGTRWSIPGDFATLEPDGTIVLLGRGSLVINSGGEKIFPEEVEASIKEHPDISDVIVVGVPDERFGQKVAAVVSAHPGKEVSLEELNTFLADRIAGFKLPRKIKVVTEVKRTAVGKPDYKWAASVVG